MTLSPAESEQYYRIWWPLLNYVNRQQNLVANFPESPEFGNVKLQDARIIRNALWESNQLLDAFIAANPAGLSEEDLALAESWEYRRQGRFIVMKHLKKYSVFLDEAAQPTAYGVLGIVSPLQEILPYPPPVMVEAVLLPFGDKIIIDGLIAPYNVSFGGGIRKSFNHALRTAEERRGIVTTLAPAQQAADISTAVVAGNRKILADFRKALAKDDLSEKMQKQHGDNIEDFVNQCLSTANPPRSLLDLQLDDVERYFESDGRHANRVSFKRLTKFLLNSDRIGWILAEDIKQFLKAR